MPKPPFVNRINNRIASCETGSRSFWSLAKVVSQNFCHSSFPPLKSNSGSSSCTPSSKPNLFASAFASNSNLDDQESQPPLYPTSTLTMFPIKFSTHKVRKTLHQLNKSKSSGPDGIPAIVLKSCAPELAPVLNKLFQLSYNLGIFTSSWKLTHVFPVPKKGDKSDPSNYHPIAITSLVSKTMETIITKQLLAFLETNNLLSDHRYGLRQARSTGDLLAYGVHAWSSTLESYGESRVISLHISKAFDRVWHKVFLLNCQCLVFTSPSLQGYLAFYLIGQLLLGSMAISLNLILSTQVYIRAQLSLLFCSSSSYMTCFPLHLPAFSIFLMTRI